MPALFLTVPAHHLPSLWLWQSPANHCGLILLSQVAITNQHVYRPVGYGQEGIWYRKVAQRADRSCLACERDCILSHVTVPIMILMHAGYSGLGKKSLVLASPRFPVPVDVAVVVTTPDNSRTAASSSGFSRAQRCWNCSPRLPSATSLPPPLVPTTQAATRPNCSVPSATTLAASHSRASRVCAAGEAHQVPGGTSPASNNVLKLKSIALRLLYFSTPLLYFYLSGPSAPLSLPVSGVLLDGIGEGGAWGGAVIVVRSIDIPSTHEISGTVVFCDLRAIVHHRDGSRRVSGPPLRRRAFPSAVPITARYAPPCPG